MSNPKVSVIVAIYEAESYLHKCINSLLAQTFDDFEILLINDGSTDRSGEICDKFAEKDTRIRAFHKTNEGVSATRQFGIDHALGEYSIHIDPDDWVEPTMLEELHTKATKENADMVICDFWVEFKNRTLYFKQKPTSLQPQQVLQDLFEWLHGSLCNKLIRLSCYKKYNIRLPQKSILWEDRFVNCALLLHDVKIAYLNKAFYHYDYHTSTNSLTRKLTVQSLQSQIYFINYFETLLRFKFPEISLFLLKAHAKEGAFIFKLLSYADFKNLYKEINHEYLKKVQLSPTWICTSLSIIGLRRTSRLLWTLYKRIHSLLVWMRVK